MSWNPYIPSFQALNAYLLENPLGTKLECILYTLHDICDFAHARQEELLMSGDEQDRECVTRHILQHRVSFVYRVSYRLCYTD